MQIQGYDITCKRGETFTIDMLLQNRDSSPYVITSKAENPYFLITVSSTKYEQEGRLVKNYWLEIPKKSTFYCTNAIKIENFESAPKLPDGETYDDLDTYAVYYTEDENGNKIYKRWLVDKWVDYELRIVKTFSKSETAQLVGQSYVYSINFVDGEDMLTYLQNIVNDEFSGISIPNTKEECYNVIKSIDKYANINWERELSEITLSIPIISFAKISVHDNIRGGIF